LYLIVPAIFGVLVTRQQVIDPPTWCGADDFVWETWRPPSFVEKLLSGDLVASLGGEPKCPRKRLDYREAILLIECFNNVE
jgi:hypothetical protein